MTILSRLRSINLLHALTRFPLASVIAMAVSVILMIALYHDFNDAEPFLRTIIAGYMAFLIAIICRLWVSTRKSGTLAIVIEWVVPLITALLWFWYLPSDFDADTIRMFRLPYILLGWILVYHLMIAFTPFIGMGTDRDFWEYNKRLFTSFAESSLFSLILYSGLSIAIVAVDQLFDLNVDGNTYGYLAIFLGGIFNTWYFLSGCSLPDYNDQIEVLQRPYVVFVQYILIPIVFIYLLILYAYGAKIGMTWELPRGWIGKLTLCFSTAGLLTYLLNYFLYTSPTASAISKQYRQWFFTLLIVPSILLCVSIYRRVTDYGITENRYIVIALSIWIISLVFLYVLRSKASIRWIPMSLAAITVIGLIGGPASMFGTTISSQSNRLKSSLISSERLVDGRIVSPAPSDIKEDWSTLRALGHRADLSLINDWLVEPLQWTTSDSMTGYDRIDRAYELLNINELDRLDDANAVSYLNFYVDRKEELDVSAYDRVSFFDQPYGDGNIVSFDSRKGELTITLNKTVTKVTGDSLNTRYAYLKDKISLSSSDLTYQLITPTDTVTIFFNNLSLQPAADKWKIANCQGLIAY